MTDKNKIAKNLRCHLERRLSTALGCEPEDLRKTKLGSLIHLSFLVHGDQECLSGFTTCIRAVVDLIGPDILWADPVGPAEEKTAQVVVN
jgi:hypothetical protein